VTAAAMQKWAYVNFALAVLFGVPAFLNAPFGLAAICVSALLSLAVVVRSFGVRYGLCDLALLLLFGPLLTMGIALASFGGTGWSDAALGLAFGATTLWVFQVRQFENLFRSRPENFRTVLGHLNFDRARWVCVLEGFFLLALHPAMAVVVRVPMIFLVLLPLMSVPGVLLINRLFKAQSPLSSTLTSSSRWALSAHMGWTFWWIAALGAVWLS
jgi:hypothetical protein